jgi:hypothetical protein
LSIDFWCYIFCLLPCYNILEALDFHSFTVYKVGKFTFYFLLKKTERRNTIFTKHHHAGLGGTGRSNCSETVTITTWRIASTRMATFCFPK